MQKPKIDASEYAFKNKYVSVVEDDITFETETGSLHKKYYTVESPDFAVVIIHDKKSDELLVLNQYRHPVQKFCIEFIAGLIDDGEDAAAAATREAQEEGAIIAKTIQFLGKINPLEGQNSCAGYVFLVDDFDIALDNELEEYEEACGLTTRWVKVNELLNLVDNGDFNGGVSLSALFKFLQHKHRILKKEESNDI